MSKKTQIAIERLERALRDLDNCKSEHSGTTQALTEAKKDVDIAARAVVDAQNGAVSLFDAAEEEAEAPADPKPRGRRKAATAGPAAP